MMITKSIKNHECKVYISLCADGSNDLRLRNMIINDPMILTTKNNYNDGIYYSVKNLRLETTKLLLEHGLKIALSEVHGLMASTWHCSPESYLFLKKIGTNLYETEDPRFKHYNKYLLETYEKYLINSHELPRLFKILEMEKILTSEYLQKILEKYRLDEREISYLSDFTKRKYLQNIRHLQLDILL